MDNQWREISAVWVGGTSMVASNPAGVCVQMGAVNGQPGMTPMELVLVALAGCTGSDIAWILEKERQSFESLQVRVRAKRAEDFPKVYTEFEVVYSLRGVQLDENAVERAIRLSEEKYCSVGLMLEKAAPIRSRYEILPPEPSSDSAV